MSEFEKAESSDRVKRLRLETEVVELGKQLEAEKARGVEWARKCGEADGEVIELKVRIAALEGEATAVRAQRDKAEAWQESCRVRDEEVCKRIAELERLLRRALESEQVQGKDWRREAADLLGGEVSE